MKKYIIIVSIIIVLIALSLIFLNQKSESNNDCNVDINEIQKSINDIIVAPFIDASGISTIEYIDMDFSDIKEYVFYIRDDDSGEFYAIFKDLTKDQKNDLKRALRIKKAAKPDEFEGVEIKEHDDITYLVFSKQYSHLIEGIIRSYIYCEES